MKKIFVLLLAVIVLLSSVSLAEDFSSLADDELLGLYMRVTEEMARRGMAVPETAGEGPQSAQASEAGEETPEIPDDTLLYYHPEGGQYYHADRNCISVNGNFLPLQGMFWYAELEDEAYRALQPCKVCGAPARRENRTVAVSFGDAVDAAASFVQVREDIDYLAAAIEADEKYVRVVTLPDDQARQLYMNLMSADDPGEAYEAYHTYAWSLPVGYIEEITARPKEQAELDALAGKTVSELEGEGYETYGSGGGIGLPTVVDMVYGFFNYEFEVDASFEEYQEYRSRDNLGSLTVKSGKLTGLSPVACDLDYLADGTYDPEVVPNITAEEAAAALIVPPLEEYSKNAWPLTAESYSDLRNNMEERYGQVYMVEGVVYQVLSRDPLRVIMHTGEDGKSQPVIIECPGQLSFDREAGGVCRIYADVSSACYILPVLTARYMLISPSETEP